MRKIILCDKEIRNNQWTDRRRWLCPDITAMSLGIVGFGQVGREVAKRALNELPGEIGRVKGKKKRQKKKRHKKEGRKGRYPEIPLYTVKDCRLKNQKPSKKVGV